MAAKVYSSPTSEQVAASLGKYLLSQQNKALSTNTTFKVAVSGGSLGKVLKKALIDDESIKNQIQWDKWEIYFSDERLVPLNHQDSNYGLFHLNVLQHLSVKPTVYTIDETKLTGKNGEVDGSDSAKDEEIAEDYSKYLPKDLKIDTILLGCGPDGHTCSLFPGHKLLQENTKSIAYINDSPKPPPRRITFTFPVLKAATAVAFVAEGADKAPVFKQIFNDPTSRLPSQLVNEIDSGTEVSWFVNENTLTGVDVIASKY